MNFFFLANIQSTNLITTSLSEFPFIVNLFFMGLIAPIVEELIFRKWFIDRTIKYGQFFAVLASSLAFGLIHANIYQLFYAGALGMIFGIIYIKAKNVIYPIIMHMIINTSTMCFSASNAYFEKHMPPDWGFGTFLKMLENPPDNMLAISLAGGAKIGFSLLSYVALLVGIIFAGKNKNFFKLDKHITDIPKSNRIKTLFFNIGGIGFFLFFTGMTILNFILMQA